MKVSYYYSLSFKEEVIRLYHLGFSPKEISVRTGISVSYLKRLLQRYLAHGVCGLDFQAPCHLSQKSKLSIIRDIESKVLSLSEASLRYGVSLTSLYNWLKQYRIVGASGFMHLKGPSKGTTKEEPMKKDSTSQSCQTPRERELELELKKALVEVAYLKKLRALLLAEEKKSSFKKPLSSKN